MEEWAVRVIQGLYTDVKSCVHVNGQYSKEFGVGVGVHQRSFLSPLLFILVLEALLRQFRTGVPCELLYADDLAVMADSLEGPRNVRGRAMLGDVKSSFQSFPALH